MSHRIVSDDHSDHGLPIGAIVEQVEAPDWAGDDFDVKWYSQGGMGDEVAVDPRDIEEA